MIKISQLIDIPYNEAIFLIYISNLYQVTLYLSNIASCGILMSVNFSSNCEGNMYDEGWCKQQPDHRSVLETAKHKRSFGMCSICHTCSNCILILIEIQSIKEHFSFHSHWWQSSFFDRYRTTLTKTLKQPQVQYLFLQVYF